MKRLTKLEESNTLHDELLLLLKQLLKFKVAKAVKKIKTEVRSRLQIKKEVKKEKTVSYCTI
jgi:hypothetical protein